MNKKFRSPQKYSWIIFLLLLAAPLVLKGIHVDEFIYTRTGAKYLGAAQVLANDAVIYAFILALLYLSFFPKLPRIASIVLRAAALSVFGLYVIDCLVIVNFNTHLVLGDAIKYASYSLEYIQQIYREKLFFILITAFAISGPAIWMVLTKYKITNRILHAFAVGAILIILFISCLTDNRKYIHSWIYKNIISYNLGVLSESKAYSADFIRKFSYKEQTDCYTNTPGFPNIIILMVESLSSHQSQFFSGIENWVPNIDRIARRNLSFTNFYANGFTTEDAEIALLTGQLPIYPPSSYTDGGGTSFNGFYDLEQSLPNILKHKGYTTDFLTTADLGFSNSGAWAASIGFDYVEGHAHSYYENWTRFHFKAAPDEALYHRILERIRHHANDPYFLFVKTVSSHHPFVNPESRNKSERDAILYVDDQIGAFYKQLIDSGFFNNGLLIIVGDHRAMVPVNKEEVELYGTYKAAAKVPLIISYGDTLSGIDQDQYQQVDIFNSLKNLTSNTRCYSIWSGDLLGRDRIAPKYIAHRRGDYRDKISIFSQGNEFLIKLDGDHTRMANSPQADSPTQKVLINKINAARLFANGPGPVSPQAK